jgi:hypothetical protein
MHSDALLAIADESGFFDVSIIQLVCAFALCPLISPRVSTYHIYSTFAFLLLLRS